jgi:type I restriction enzyme S subunit
MTVDLQPYPAYKDSGVPWLGEVPAHWEVRSLGSILRRTKERNRSDLPLLSVVREKGVILRSVMSDTENHNFVPDDLSNYRVVRRGNLVINKMKSWQGSLGISEYDGVVSPAYFVFDCDFADRQYLHRLLRSKTYVSFFGQASDGVRVDQWDLSIDRMRRIPVLTPPPDEQTAIVRYLDHVDRRIRRYIRAKQKLIALLNEQKQAIIHQAVTRGLDPNVRLRPSGVEWLGDVPEHWEVCPLRRITIARCDGPFGSGLKSTHYTQTGIRVIRLQNIGHAEFKGEDRAFISPEHYASLGDHAVLAGDVLIAGLGDERIPPGRACVAPEGIGISMVKADCFRFRVNSSRVSPDFLAFHLTATAVPAAAALSTGATRQRVNLQSTASRPVALPPLPDQILIVEMVRGTAVEPLAVAQEALQREIALIREYRTRLIADVVTGKLDVRAAAAALPEEVEEPEASEDETPDEVDEVEENDLDSASEEVEP